MLLLNSLLENTANNYIAYSDISADEAMRLSIYKHVYRSVGYACYDLFKKSAIMYGADEKYLDNPFHYKTYNAFYRFVNWHQDLPENIGFITEEDVKFADWSVSVDIEHMDIKVSELDDIIMSARIKKVQANVEKNNKKETLRFLQNPLIDRQC